jgi:hypothetical protein
MTSQERTDWLHRDVSDACNRRAYQALFRLAGFRDEKLFAVIFDRLRDSRFWLPYGDTPLALRRLIDVDAPLGQQLLHVTVGESEAQVPPHRQGDHLRREPKSGEARSRRGHSGRAMTHQPSLPTWDGADATVPAWDQTLEPGT